MAENPAESARDDRSDATGASNSTGISYTTRAWAIFPLSPMVDTALELSGLLGNSVDSTIAFTLGLVITVVLAELLLRTVGPAIVGPLWFGVFTLICGALFVLAAASVVDLESDAIQRTVFALLLACSALVVGVTTRQRLENGPARS
ncbi:hypothetical protein HALLA_18840 [Halostagnicola larsenii XH-48]|uniref:Uncharacterized protein n=1 Tax=Halostagnicola larsenii XH-48 TaxID=797299 RepID=W0JR17_9EURY|nr:hypothetical protein [Halostagnicola larsenii]AHG01176.1 hypothetical protein HALLA_18840 [Halostagnicola larsenii XH-48]